MTPKEKAAELKMTFWKNSNMSFIEAKQCALIAVDEILKIHSDYNLWSEEVGNFINGYKYYWNEVKAQIEKL